MVGQDTLTEEASPGAFRARAGKRRGRRAPGALSHPAAVRAATWGLWLVVAAGFGMAAMALARGAGPDPRGTPRERPSSSGAEGFAELYVAAYLQAGEGTEEDLRTFTPQHLDLTGVVPGSLYTTRAASVGARRAAPGYWSVTVAAELLGVTEDGYAPAGLRYFTVGIVETAGGYAAAGPPAEVPGPGPAEAAELRIAVLEPPADDALSRAVARFLDAYLASEGEMSRYVAPGSGLRPLMPPPYAEAEVTAAGFTSSERGRLARVRVRATDGSGRVTLLEYSLRLAERGGRWEVTDLLEAPPIGSH